MIDPRGTKHLMRTIAAKIAPDLDVALFRQERGSVVEQQDRQLAIWCAYELGENSVEIAEALGCTHQNVSWATAAVRKRMQRPAYRTKAHALRLAVNKDLGR